MSSDPSVIQPVTHPVLPPSLPLSTPALLHAPLSFNKQRKTAKCLKKAVFSKSIRCQITHIER